MKQAMKKNTFREIRSSFGRWAAILAIVALGVGFFCGLKMCTSDFVLTGDIYVNKYNLYDCELMTTLGLEDEDVAKLQEVEGVKSAEGSWSTDLLFTLSDSAAPSTSEAEGEHVAKAHTILDSVNQLSLKAGRMPENQNEFLGDSRYFSESDLGKILQLTDSNDSDTLELFNSDQFKLVGLIDSPEYLNFERGSTSLGNGSVSCFIYLPKEAWNSDIYTEVYIDYADDFTIFSDEYEANTKVIEKRLEEVLDQCGDRRYDLVIDDAEEALADAKAEIDEAEAELKDAKAQLESGRAELASGQAELDANRKKLADGRKQLNSGRETLVESRKQYEEGKAELDTNKQSIADARTEYEAGLLEFETQRDGAYAEVDQALAAGMLSAEQATAKKAEIDQQMAPAKAQLDAALSQIQTGEAQIAAAETELSSALTQLTAGESELAAKEKELTDGEKALIDGQAELDSARAELDDGEKEIADGEKEIDDARKELRKAEDDLDDITYPSMYVLGRDTNIGYACFENDSKIVDAIASVFPVFFLLVAALVCMTTMSRMIDEQRTQIGVLKALGYSRGQIMSKFIIYSGSAATIGAIVGFFIGIHLFPWVVWDAYGMMYGFASIKFKYNWILGILSLIVSVLCCVGTTLWCCISELREVPAQLIRPKAPQAGKRIWLEYIPFLWNRFSFLVKVSIRNTFRYRQRFIMMVIGISGCTALLITGLGVKDSIANVVSAQYDNIYHVDYTVSFKKDMKEDDQQRFLDESKSVLSDCLFMYTSSVDARANGLTKSVNLVVCSEEDDTTSFIELINDDGDIPWPTDGQGVINSNLAENMDLSVGDTLTVYDSDMREMTVEIVALCDNYVNNYLYINEETYENHWGHLEKNSAFVLGISDEDGELVDPHGDSTALMNARNVAAVSVTSDFRDRIDNMMKSMDYIMLVIVACAGILAFIVLYNLTNINITERIREIATIKVLGFYASETAQYVFRENVLLTAVAAIVGIPLGKALHAFVMSKVKIDMISFDVHIAPLSYALGIVLTFVFAFIVNLAMRRKLAKVSMTESLKSIE